MNVPSVRQRLLDGQPAFGFELILGSTAIAELMAPAGLDFVLLDLQHGRWTEQSALEACVAMARSSSTPMARVARNEFWEIGRVLDHGLLGIIVPTVDTRAEAQAVADAAHYPPRGQRSWGWGRAPFTAGAAHRTTVERDAFIAVQIESIGAVGNAEAILSTDGIDGCWIGPSDLALSMGIAPEEASQHDGHIRAVERVLEACHNTGKVPGFATGSVQDACARADQGFRFLTVGNDAGFLRNACTATHAHLAAWRQARDTGTSPA